MQLNEKIKEYRRIFDLSQEELASKLNVSRQAITKWENDGGIPDIGNLKPMADLFDVSIDYLLDDEKNVYNPIMKEPILINKNNYSNRYDYVVALLKERYPQPNEIYGLTQTRNMSKLEWLIDFLIQPGIVDMVHYLNEFAFWFLIKKETQKLLVKVTEEYIETRELSNLINEEKFVVEKNKFVKASQI